MAELTRTQVNKLKAKFIVQDSTNAPDNAQLLSALSTGLLKVTTGTGVLTTATAADYVSPSITITAGAGLSGGGDLSANRTISMPNVGPGAVTTGTAGVTSIQTDAQGRVVAITTATYALASVTVSAGTGLSGGGDLSANRTISMPNVGPGATTTGTAGVTSIQTDAQGRIVAISTATYALASITVTGASGISSGGDLSTNRTLTNDLITGKAGGQTISFGTASGESGVLTSTVHATKGFISLGSTTGFTFDETNSRIGLGTAAPEAGIKIGNTSLGLSAFYGAGTLPAHIGVQSAAGTFPGITIGNDSTHQIRIYWQDSSAQISSAGGSLDVSPATAVTFYTTTGGRIANDGAWLMGNISTNSVSKMRLIGTKTIASATSATWNSFDLTASTLTVTGSTHVTTATGVNFANIVAPTITDASAVTIDLAATLAISGAPTAAGSVTLTNGYALWVQGGSSRFDGNIDLSSGARNIVLDATTGTKIGTATSQKLGFFNSTPVVQQTRGATLTNNATAGGTTDQVDDFTGAVYATDAATIRNDIYQLARALRQHDVALRALGLFS